MVQMEAADSTRLRLLEAGMRQFAAQGFRATSVGSIEAAVGLQPRRGALYKHFSSKHALLTAAVRELIDRTASGATQITEVDAPPVDDAISTESVILSLGRWFLEQMDQMKDLTQMLEHDGRRMPDVTAEVKRDLVDLSYRTAASVVAAAAPQVADPEATAVLILGALVAIRRTEWTFGSPPLEIDDDRILATWTKHTLALISPNRERSDSQGPRSSVVDSP